MRIYTWWNQQQTIQDQNFTELHTSRWKKRINPCGLYWKMFGTSILRSRRSATGVLSTGMYHRTKFTILSYQLLLLFARTRCLEKPPKNFSIEHEPKSQISDTRSQLQYGGLSSEDRCSSEVFVHQHYYLPRPLIHRPLSAVWSWSSVKLTKL
jgi:hypothetical protein